MRILFAANLDPDPDSGASGTEVQTLRALRALGAEVDTIWKRDLAARIRHPNLNYLLELPREYRRAILGRLATAEYDIIHANQPHCYLAARAARVHSRPTPLVHRSHGFEPRARRALEPWRRQFGGDARSPARQTLSRLMAALLEFNYRMVARHASGHIVSASECKAYLVERYGVPPERVSVIPQAAAEPFLSRPAKPLTLERMNCLLYVGQLAFFKGPMITADIVRSVLRRRNDATMTWVTSAEHHDAIRSLIGDAEILKRVRLLGWREQSALAEIFDSHGIFLFPSFFEGFGKAALEAMARGLVTVASNTGGMRDFIRHQENGILVETGDASSFSARVLEVMSDPARAQALSTRAAADAQTYSWADTGRQTLAFYEKVICAAPPMAGRS